MTGTLSSFGKREVLIDALMTVEQASAQCTTARNRYRQFLAGFA